MGYLVFCDVDVDGNIIDALSGINIIPDRQYEYFFYTTDQGVVENIFNYKVDMQTRQLIKIEG